MFTPLFPESQGAPVLPPGVRRQRERGEHHDRGRAASLYRDREFTTIDEGKVLAGGDVAFLPRAGPDGRPHVSKISDVTLPAPGSRTLVLGDPIVSLGEQTLIPDGALIVEGSTIVAAGRAHRAARREVRSSASSARRDTS